LSTCLNHNGRMKMIKAFDDLKHRHDYNILFDTHKRGFLALRGAHVTTRNHS
jgi:hypothetical protein